MRNLITQSKVLEIEAVLSQSTLSQRLIAEMFGVRPETVRRIARGKHHWQLPKDEQQRREDTTDRGAYMPTPEEIEAACKRIRRERRRHRGVNVYETPYEVPVVSLAY